MASCLEFYRLLITTSITSQIFPSYSSAKQPVAQNSNLAKIKERRARTKAAAVGVPIPDVSAG
jgi:hypothetical protein